MNHEEVVKLNELARLYPWRVFNQRELQLMTGYPEAVISAAFADPEFSQRFRLARPEAVREWANARPIGVSTKEV